MTMEQESLAQEYFARDFDAPDPVVSPVPQTLVPSAKKLSDLRILTMPQAGIDRLSFMTWDTIEVPGFGEDTFELRGYYVIERANPTSAIWHQGSVDIMMLELSVSGISSKFGRVHVSTNPDIGRQSGGQVRPGTRYPGVPDSPKMCEMSGYMQFALADQGMTVFNKEPILLRHLITHIPPIGQGGGTQGRVAIDLYRKDNPEGPPVAILREVRTHIGSWMVD
jgi:hypothetical protein